MTKTTFTAQGYTCPECKTIEAGTRRVLCVSNFGSPGAAGGNVNVDDDDEDY